MALGGSNKFKPLYKHFIRLRENVQNRQKLLGFRKKKWKRFCQTEQKKLKWYAKYKPKDQTQYIVSSHPTRWSSYSKRYKNSLILNKKLKLLYGGLPQKVIKRQIRKTLSKNSRDLVWPFLSIFESRLDVILYKAKFTDSIRSSRQLIVHRKIFVNKKIVKTNSYLLKKGDLITIDLACFDSIRLSIKKCLIWPVPPKHLIINYKTLQIIFGKFKNWNLSLNFPYHLHLEKIITSYYHN